MALFGMHKSYLCKYTVYTVIDTFSKAQNIDEKGPSLCFISIIIIFYFDYFQLFLDYLNAYSLPERMKKTKYTLVTP